MIIVFAPLLLAMAAGQLASLDRFEEALRGYRVFGDLAPAVAVAVPAVEAFVAVALLFRRRLPSRVVTGAGVAGLVVAAFWSLLAAQAFARGLALENCGCFGAYLAQELRWWVLLEDAEFLVLAALSARALGIGLSLLGRPVNRAATRPRRSLLVPDPADER